MPAVHTALSRQPPPLVEMAPESMSLNMIKGHTVGYTSLCKEGQSPKTALYVAS
ncbi:hypothetical protein ACRRTK_010507 [Alexandromys fortis]